MSTTDAETPRQSRWHAAFARPSETMHTYLVPGEDVLLIDEPALNAFLIEELPLVLLVLLGASIATVWGQHSGHLAVVGIAMIFVILFVVYLRAKRWAQQYTAYVLTTSRVLRISGFLKRSAAWIPWVKVTDVRFEASLMGRMLGYATVYIDSANETSGLTEMKNLRDPRRFYITLTELVQLKQGPMPPSQRVQLHD